MNQLNLFTTPNCRLSFKDWQLREGNRLYNYGRQSLSHTELLAHLIRSKETAERLLHHFGTLKAIADASIEELQTVDGVGEAIAEIISVAVEFGRRSRCLPDENVNLSSPEAVYDFVRDDMEELQQEHLKAILLNTKNNVIKVETIFIGTLDSSVIHPREIFKTAIRASAASIIALHNHPAGNPSPSTADISITRQLMKAGEVIGIALYDHIIVGKGRYVSLKEQGII